MCLNQHSLVLVNRKISILQDFQILGVCMSLLYQSDTFYIRWSAFSFSSLCVSFLLSRIGKEGDEGIKVDGNFCFQMLSLLGFSHESILFHYEEHLRSIRVNMFFIGYSLIWSSFQRHRGFYLYYQSHWKHLCDS